jgi:hypothetical protein
MMVVSSSLYRVVPFSVSSNWSPLGCITRFYEKVVKVKADVAAILNFFSRSTPQIEAGHLDAAPVVPTGGMRKGGFSGAL